MKKKKFNPIREIVADMHIDGVRFNEQVLAAIKAQQGIPAFNRNDGKKMS